MKLRITSLKDCIKADIHIAIDMCQILNRYDLMPKLCILLVKVDYLDYWEVVEELECLNKKLMKLWVR